MNPLPTHRYQVAAGRYDIAGQTRSVSAGVWVVTGVICPHVDGHPWGYTIEFTSGGEVQSRVIRWADFEKINKVFVGIV